MNKTLLVYPLILSYAASFFGCSSGLSDSSPPPPAGGNNLKGAGLNRTDLRGADLAGANFHGAIMPNAVTSGAEGLPSPTE